VFLQEINKISFLPVKSFKSGKYTPIKKQAYISLLDSGQTHYEHAFNPGPAACTSR
jgi:hypothetical protein